MTRTRNEKGPNPFLTDAELTVVSLQAQGYTLKQIAEKLNMAEKTVKNHLHAARQKHVKEPIGKINLERTTKTV